MVVLFVILLVIAIIIVAATWVIQDHDGFSVGIAIAACLVIGGAIMGYQYLTNFANEHTVTCHVTGKDRGNDNGSYRIYTSDCGTLADHDTWFQGKTNSSDIWQQIPDKGTVTVTVAGVRFSPFSWFPNVLEVTPAK